MAAAPCLPGLERVPTGTTLETPPAGCFIPLQRRDIGEATPHYKTVDEANAAHRAYYGKDGPLAIDQVLTQLVSPCVELSCQCGAYARPVGP
jgi:hypothetical protein